MKGSLAEIFVYSTAEMSPELVPRWRPPKTPRGSSDSFIGRKTRKRMILIDSDTDNSIVIEHNKNTKHACIMDTPAKIGGKALTLNESVCDKSEIADDDNQNNDNHSENEIDSDKEEELNHSKADEETKHDDERTEISDDKLAMSDRKDCSAIGESSDETGRSSAEARSDRNSEDNCDGFDEDQMVMSRATRMSIMGYAPKETPSDDSDFIQSDDVSDKYSWTHQERSEWRVCSIPFIFAIVNRF